MRKYPKLYALLLALVLAAALFFKLDPARLGFPELSGLTQTQSVGAAVPEPAAPPEDEKDAVPDEDGSYTTAEDVCAYLLAYGRLPANFITKKEAQALGWPGGSLEEYAPGKCIGGDRFGNREGQLPKAPGRTWTECDINTLGAKSRGAERLVFSNDGLIYYTDDHYESFRLLAGNP